MSPERRPRTVFAAIPNEEIFPVPTLARMLLSDMVSANGVLSAFAAKIVLASKSDSITAPAASTLVASVTSAPSSTFKIVRASAALIAEMLPVALRPTKVLGVTVKASGVSSAFAAKIVLASKSDSITAPAESTLAASVTSAPSSTFKIVRTSEAVKAPTLPAARPTMVFVPTVKAVGVLSVIAAKMV